VVFSSNIFLFIFLPTVLLFYYASPRPLRFATLTLFSYAFYAWSDPRFVLLLLWVTLVDFIAGNLIGGHWPLPLRFTSSRLTFYRRLILTLSLTNSLGLLAYFKYAMLGQELLNHLREYFGQAALPIATIVLPAGISFYTFESISYVVDIYRGIARPASERFLAAVPPDRRTPARYLLAELRSLVSFACYLAQFPHLVAGPIIRYQDLEPQLHQPETNVENFGRGVFFLSLGLAKKILIADTLARAVDPAFSGVYVGAANTWWATFAFSFQLYFDFSGYSDMAIGLALMLGFRFPKNFDAPYRATSVTDFWRRWHITLSSWLRDYLYIPLGGNRKGPARTYLNLLITMLLGGLWHGAALNFAAWGLYHGLWLALERRSRDRRPAAPPPRLPRPLQIAITFLIVTLGWTIFRSENLLLALYRLTHMFLPGGDLSRGAHHAAFYDPQIVTAMAAAALVAFFGIPTWDLAQRITPAKIAFALLLFCASVVVLALNSTGPFLYFRF
jgi:alginate O-acetyltransferase complex protein AlgI